MAANSTHTRKKILQEGLSLLSASGLSGVTLGVLAERVGMSKSGLFAHFRSKDDVQIALLNYMTECGNEFIIAPAMAQPEGLPRLHCLLRQWFGWTEKAGLPGGCPIAAGLFECDDVEGAVRDAILRIESEWRGLLHQLIVESAKVGHLALDTDADQFVWEICGIYLGHHASLRFFRASDADARATVAVNALIERFATKRGKALLRDLQSSF